MHPLQPEIPFAPYSQQFTVRWHDTDANRRARPSAVLTYFQECANRQCAAYGYELDNLRDTAHLAFILSHISIRFDAPLHAYDNVLVQTWCPPSHAYSFNRCFRMLRDGITVAEATSVWALVNLTDRSFVRASDFSSSCQFPSGPALPTDSLLPRARLQPDLALTDKGSRRIGYSDLDYNLHMNNTRYPDMFCDFCPDAEKMRVTGLSIHYQKEAAAGDNLHILTASRENTHYFRAVKADGTAATEAVMQLAPV